MSRSKLLLILSLIVILSCNNEPYEGTLDFSEEIPCNVAEDNTVTAETNFVNANTTDYLEQCLAYKQALENQILACQDESGNLTMQLDNLADCNLSSFFQVSFDDQTFFANASEAYIGNGTLTINAYRGTDGEMVELILHEVTPGVYQFGTSNSTNQTNIATYTSGNSNPFSWQSVTDFIQPQGLIVITEIDYYNLTISGNFNFTGYNNNGEIKDFTNGLFIRIPFDKENEFFAKVDGEEFVETNLVAGPSNFFDTIGVYAINGNNQSILVSVPDNIFPGTYNFGVFSTTSTSTAPTGEYVAGLNDFHFADGNVTITLHNPDLRVLIGSFSFTAEPHSTGVGTYEITEGSFCVRY